MSVKIGDRFRAVYADSQPVWEVVRRSGRSAVIAVSQAEIFNGQVIDDYAGIEQAFTVKQVEAAKRWDRTLVGLGEQQESFYAGLKLGQIVHYHDGFSKFVRCEVVVGTEDNISLGNEDLIGQLVLQPVALVGNWSEYDLPRRNLKGEIVLGYHADKIVNRNGAWRANEGCVFESASYNKNRSPGGFEPSDLPAIDLSVPEMTPAEQEAAAAEQMRAKMIDLLQVHGDAKSAVEAAVSLALGVKS